MRVAFLFAAVLLCGLISRPLKADACSYCSDFFGTVCCGDVGQTACVTVCTGNGGCKDGLHYDSSTAHCESACSYCTTPLGTCCGDLGQPSCAGLGTETGCNAECKPGLHYNGITAHCELDCSYCTTPIGTCCGDLGQPSCGGLGTETGCNAQCAPGLHYDGSTLHCEAACPGRTSSFGNCCGGVGQVVCDPLVGDACDSGLHYDGSTTHCENGCSWGTSIGGNCCGDVGQVVCAGDPSCKPGLHYDGSTLHCELPCSYGVTAFGNCCGDVGQTICLGNGFDNCKDGLVAGIFTCEIPRQPGESCGPDYPCADGATCNAFYTGNGVTSLHCMTSPENNLVSNPEVCKSYYSAAVSDVAVASHLNYNFGVGAGASALVGGSVERGVFYTEDGRYGCYNTLCSGVEVNAGISIYTTFGFADHFDEFNGIGYSVSASLDIPLTEIGISGTEGWSSFNDFGHTPPVWSGFSVSAGVGLSPLSVGGSYCNTETTIVVDSSTVRPSATPVAKCHDVEPVPGCGAVVATASIDNGSYSPTAGVAVTLRQSPSGPYPIGTTPVTLTVTDSNGLTNTCNARVILPDNATEDTTPPTITCPPNISVQCQSLVPVPLASLVTVYDNCGLWTASFVGDDRQAGSPVTLRTYKATDVTGNSSTCQQTITVIDTIPPSIVTKNATVYVNGSGNAGVAPADVFQSGTDNCLGAVIPFSVSPNYFNCSNLGSNAVTLTAKDASGNSTTAGAFVTVVDNTPPILVTRPATVYLDATGHAGISSSDVYRSGTDNCSTVNVGSVVPNSFTCANLGANLVNLSADDGHGNSTSTSAGVTVVDNLSPVVTCPGGQDVNATSPAGATVTFAATATDNCRVASLVPAPASGSVFPIGTSTVTYTAKDGSNNQALCSFNVHVKSATEQTNDLLSVVNSLSINTRLKQTLAFELAGVLREFGSTPVQCGQLRQFVKTVKKAQKQKQLTSSQAAQLHTTAARLGAVTRCP